MSPKTCSDKAVVLAARYAKAGIDLVFRTLYRVNFRRCDDNNLPEFEGRLHSPSGQKVWATVKGKKVKVVWRTSDGRIHDEIVTVDPSRARRLY